MDISESVVGVLQHLEHDIFKLMMLIVDVIASSINVFLQATQGVQALAIVTLVSLSIFAIASIIMIVVFSCGLVFSVEEDELLVSTTSVIVIIGSILYYIGDNVPPIVAAFAESLSCDDVCLENVQSAGKCLLFGALICFQGLPSLVEKILGKSKKGLDEQPNSDKEHIFTAAVILQALALMLDYDLFYSIVWGVDTFTVEGTCTTGDLGGSWACWALMVIIWTVCIIIYVIAKIFTGNLSNDRYNVVLVGAIPLLCITLTLYLLGDNDEPIGCVCNDGPSLSTMSSSGSGGFEFIGNMTTVGGMSGCTKLLGKQIRAGLMLGTMLVLGGILTLSAVTTCLL